MSVQSAATSGTPNVLTGINACAEKTILQTELHACPYLAVIVGGMINAELTILSALIFCVNADHFLLQLLIIRVF